MIFFINIKKYLPFLVLFSLISCNKTDWRENFKEVNKSPFGTFIVFNEAEDLFSTNDVHYLKENIYDYLFYHVESDDYVNYICIKSSAYKLDVEGLTYLLNQVKLGSTAFLSLNYFSEHLKDSLQFTTKNLDEDIYSPEELKKLNGTLYLENKDFKNQPFLYDRNIRKNYFDRIDKENTVVLGTIDVDGIKQPNFIKIHHGDGAVFLHTNPVVFTNYNMLNGRENYVENLFSYIPSGDILWDSQIKSSMFTNRDNDKKDSIFKFFLGHPSLTWFLFVSLFGLLLFMLFNARRKQRAVPIIKPLQNSTVEFAHTIANLYLKEADHKNLVDKKITYFLEKIRDKYLIDTNNLNSQFIEKLALKSNNDLASTKYLINTIIALNKKTECTDVELMVLNNMIEKFFKK
ncbi:hypothetical protein [Xanthomarina sp.]|uniref:hypothetical protein n=1 Tax=Xanthomarina sp. TaxID=1931211 RepID=UPI002C24CB0D|nr:hypothetical protein [Xanthomarina sp.]HLV39401.1 hypothetical protein [Xanthomarina sp.]